MYKIFIKEQHTITKWGYPGNERLTTLQKINVIFTATSNQKETS